jgi:hypothetical protein
MRKLSLIEIILGVAGLLAIFGGFRLDQPLLLYGGFVLLGLTFVVGGVDAILARELRYSSGTGSLARSVIHEGPPAVLLGIASLIAGLWVAGFGAAGLLGRGDALLDTLLRRPGLALVSLGGVLIGVGAAMMLGAREDRRSAASFLMSLPGRFGGLVIAALGAAALLGGLFEMASPPGFDAYLYSIFGDLVESTFLNQARNLEEDRIRIVQAVFERPQR